MARLVMVHGAFAGAWKWAPLTGPLEAAGHTVEAFDLPGSGEDQTPIAEVTLDAYVERTSAQLDERDEPAVLVASSMGGVICTQTAALRPEQVEAIVYVAAFVPEDGQSLIDLTQLPEGADDEIQANMVVAGDPPVATMPYEASKSAEYGDCLDQDMNWAYPKQRPQAVVPFTQPVRIPNGSLDSVGRAYVICTRDRSIPPALQRRMVAENGIADVVELETDHSPMISSTPELARAIDKLVSDVLEHRREPSR
jgi:pimeloyl-ACP methyl ester carboxylesterase